MTTFHYRADAHGQVHVSRFENGQLAGGGTRPSAVHYHAYREGVETARRGKWFTDNPYVRCRVFKDKTTAQFWSLWGKYCNWLRGFKEKYVARIKCRCKGGWCAKCYGT